MAIDRIVLMIAEAKQALKVHRRDTVCLTEGTLMGGAPGDGNAFCQDKRLRRYPDSGELITRFVR